MSSKSGNVNSVILTTRLIWMKKKNPSLKLSTILSRLLPKSKTRNLKVLKNKVSCIVSINLDPCVFLRQLMVKLTSKVTKDKS